MDLNPSFWQDRRVLVTGHTGFKGAWLTLWLTRMGACVTGLSLPPDHPEAIGGLLRPWSGVREYLGDLRDPTLCQQVMRESDPEIILHLAAQALVPHGYEHPVATFSTNVMGTVHLLDATCHAPSLRAVVVVTSDKVYENTETGRRFREGDPLGGHDPYSASKACQEHVAASWRHAYLAPRGVALATARAGNVIGGGDQGENRLLPDIFRALRAGKPVHLRRPDAIRPWQFVLDPLRGYLLLAQALMTGNAPLAVNFGPPTASHWPVAKVAERVLTLWGGGTVEHGSHTYAEHVVLGLDAELARATLGWGSSLDIATALTWTVAWHQAHLKGDDMVKFSMSQLDAYQKHGRGDWGIH